MPSTTTKPNLGKNLQVLFYAACLFGFAWVSQHHPDDKVSLFMMGWFAAMTYARSDTK